MRDDEKLEITAGKIRKLAEKYERVKEVFPEVFEEKWVVVEDGLSLSPVFCPNECFYIAVYRLSRPVCALYFNGDCCVWDNNYRVSWDKRKLYCKIEKKV